MYGHTSYSSFPLFFVMSAVDLQSCGVTSSGAVCLQELVDVNRSLVVLDLRANELIGGGSNLNRVATHTQTHTRTHTRTHTYTHTHIHTHTHTHMHTHTCTHARSHTYTHIHVHIHMHTHFPNHSALPPLALLPLSSPVIPVCAVQP